MTKFSIKDLIIFIIALFLLEKLVAEEIIIPKPEPKIQKLTKKEIILPKTQPENGKLQKEEISQIDSKSEINERLLKKMLLPKIKPTNGDLIKLQTKKIKYLLPKKKPEDQIIDQPKFVEKGKESEKEKIIAKIDDKELIIPRKKPITYQKQKKKIATKSKYFSKSDFKLAKKIFSEIDKKRWTSAIKLTSKAKDRSIFRLVKWLYLLEPNNQANFYDYLNFININPNYPRINRLRYLLEHKINTKTISDNRVIKLFDEKEPFSGYGKLMLGQSYLSEGNHEKGISLIKNGWITARLSKKDLKYLKKKLKKYLNIEDHIKRADWLAWENKYWDLKRMLRYLPKDYRALYNARLLLMSKSYGVDNAISKVSSKFKKDPGLLYDRLKWRRKRGRVDSSLEILLKIKNDPKFLVRSDKWWFEREIISRALIYKKKYAIAYRIASNHSMKSGPEYAEAEWMSGWIALSFLDDPILATQHFHNFFENVGYPISLSRGAYWLGRSYEKLNDIESSEKWFKEASKYLTTYYGQLAFIKIYPNKDFYLDREIMQPSEIEKKEFNENELTRLVVLLHEINKTKYAKDILKHLATSNINQGSEILAGDLAVSIGRYDFAIQIAKQASYEKRFHYAINFPIIDVPSKINNKRMPSPELILAIIRQESEFDVQAHSYVGARGMMQIMTYTARLVAKRAKLPYSKKKLTSDPNYNIKLGSYYIAELLEQYEGSYPFSIAAYNAGPKRVSYWNKINGNPQKRKIDYVNWIELIKFRETRNYVQRVLENINVYKYMLRNKPIKIRNYFIDKPHY
jgi:soluble lytic murein transglycosylase